MTLIVTINGPETIWLLADRRLSRGGNPLRDDARKVMILETTDGVAILGYAGLGATAANNEPSDWLSAVLRGRNLPLEQSLGVIADAMKTQFPRHLIQMPGAHGPAHNFVATAFVGDEPRLYTIDLVFASDRKSYNFRYTRHVIGSQPWAKNRPQRTALGGSGAVHLVQDSQKRWRRQLLHVARACDRGRVSPSAVADHLANLNNEVHLGVSDKSVGPRCIVAWRHKKGSRHKGGGEHRFYTGTTGEINVPPLPTIVTGFDLEAIANAMMPGVMKNLEAMRTGQPAPAIEDPSHAFVPRKSDERLR